MSFFKYYFNYNLKNINFSKEYEKYLKNNINLIENVYHKQDRRKFFIRNKKFGE